MRRIQKCKKCTARFNQIHQMHIKEGCKKQKQSDGRNAPGSKWLGNDDVYVVQGASETQSSTTCKKIRSSFKSNSNIVWYLERFRDNQGGTKKKWGGMGWDGLHMEQKRY